MQTYLRHQIDWPQAFPPEEYAGRRKKVREELAKRKLDAIYVTTPANLTYLLGYDMIWYHLRNLTGLLIRADRDETLFFDAVGHQTIVSTTPEIREVVWFERESVDKLIDLIAGEFAARGLARAHIAVEGWGYSPHATIMSALEERLREGGAKVSDESLLVEQLRLVKSPREVEVI